MINNFLLKRYIKFYFNEDIKVLSTINTGNNINLLLEVENKDNFLNYFKKIEQYNILNNFNICNNSIKFNISLPKEKYTKLLM